MNSESNASLKLSDEELTELEELAGIGYSLKKISLYFGLSYIAVRGAFDSCMDPQPGDIRYHYERGILKTQATIDKQIVAKASEGNLTAIQIYQKQKEANDLRDLKENILNGNR